MNRTQRCLSALAALAGTLLAFAVAAPAALATLPPPDPGLPGDVPVIHTVVTGGMPAWQIALIAAGAALLAAMVAVLADRAWAARRKTALSAA